MTMGADAEPLLEIDVSSLVAALAAPGAPRLVDMRTPAERALGMLPGALALPLDASPSALDAALPDPTTDVVLYCASGQRSAAAARALRERGHRRVRSLRGGLAAWRRAGLPVDTPATGESSLSHAELERYGRQLRLPEVGLDGQRRLRAARVLCIGAGGLGSPVLLYLAAAGVGRLGIVDDDVVELGNLHRQVVHATDRVGQPKADSAARTLRALNPEVEVTVHRLRLGIDDAPALFAAHDVIVDGSDNFATRYLVNDVALEKRRPFVTAAIQGFEGQVGVFDGAPCYRCLFPEAPPAGFAPSCDEAGVLGVLPGLLGLVQATEVLKLLLGVGESLRGRLLVVDALSMRFTELRVAADPECRCHGVASRSGMPGTAVAPGG